MVFRFAANKTSERAVAVLFGMAESTLHGIIGRVASFLESISERIIRFPDSNEEKSQCSAKFEKVSYVIFLVMHVFVTTCFSF